MMNKRDFVKAILQGDKAKALQIKNNLYENSIDKTVIVHYKVPMPTYPSPEEQDMYDRFIAKHQKLNPNRKILCICIHKREGVDFSKYDKYREEYLKELY